MVRRHRSNKDPLFLPVAGEASQGRGRGVHAQRVVAGGAGADPIWAMLGVCDQGVGRLNRHGSSASIHNQHMIFGWVLFAKWRVGWSAGSVVLVSWLLGRFVPSK